MIYFKLIFFAIFINIISAKNQIRTTEIPVLISDDVQKLIETKDIPQSLHDAVSDFNKIRDRNLQNDIFCQTCDLVVSQVIAYRRIGASKESMKTFLQRLCRALTTWNGDVCDGYINIELDTFLYIIDNRDSLTGARSCAIYYQTHNCRDEEAFKWTIPLPPPPPLKPSHGTSIKKKREDKPLKILHLTDFHFDPLYSPGSNAACNLPLCCQDVNGPAKKPSEAAGLWGDYRFCDMPWHTVTNFTNYLINNLKEKYDLIYYTGDIISHKSWATDQEKNTKAIKQLFGHFNETFKNTSFYPILGNHEPHPTDFYSPSNNTVAPTVTTQWLFDLVANQWQPWLPNTTNATILKGGYYTVLVKPKFRIIALNSNVCFISNLWLLHDDKDPYDQLAWLVNVLQQAEQNGEHVHILSHIPPGHDQCIQQWSYQYHLIVNRFASTIVAQFNGHTHLDELRLFRHPKNNSQIINVAFNAGSFTTFVGFNPNYRTYSIDPTNYNVLDYDHFTFNLTLANINGIKGPEWFKLYSFKEAYGLHDTSLDSLSDLVKRISKDKNLITQYFRFMGRNSSVYVGPGCDEHCMEKTRCEITAIEAYDALDCSQIKRKKHHSRHRHYYRV